MSLLYTFITNPYQDTIHKNIRQNSILSILEHIYKNRVKTEIYLFLKGVLFHEQIQLS